MSTIMTRPARPVTTGGEEPEPQHDRDTSNPDSMPPLPRRTARGMRRYESQADEALRRSRRSDELAAAAGRRVPRTVAEMRAHLAAVEVAA